ncbi:bifunctional metallophosphatase/5'-nucleotidase [Dietzia timorensis]|uniref:Endonuclease YhcR n=1 Tax=Dietzia timorensis TaxID=499555 RepID=A0A173LP03_9ACTN|nr:5'-nucleotidase C-terminal domain-containing protein [Dietzia timorensis]ANI92977.1 Endonuclease YhcR [Dietzia timorensis]
MSPKNQCRFAASAVAVVTLVGGTLVVVPSSAGAQEDQAAGGNEITLLGINDFHGRINAEGPSTVAFADTIQTLRSEYGEDSTALISSGDNIGASLFASSFEQDEPTIDVLNALGLETSAVGNHEFDRGIDDLGGRVSDSADWSHLAANVTVDGEQMQPYEVLDINGVKVGVIGAVTEETPALVSPTGIEGVEFSDPVDAVNEAAKDLKDGNEDNGEADVIVASYHEGAATGASLEAARDGGVFSKIVDETSADVSAIYTGHTHQTYTFEAPGPDGEDRPVIQTGSYASNIGRVTLTVDPETHDVTGYEQENVPVPSKADAANLSDPVVAEVKEIVDGTLQRAKVEGEKPVGAVSGDITTAHAGGKRDDRSSESALGNLVAEFMVDAVADRGGAQIGFMNPGGLRDELRNDPEGAEDNINKAEANGVLPFANTIVTMKMTGAQIKSVLEQQWQPDGSSRPFLALGTNDALTWTFDPTRERGDRITSVSFEGQPIDESESYSVVSQSFLAGGGDNFTEFAEASDKSDTGLIDSDTWMDYISENSPLEPDFSRRAIAAKDLPDTVAAGETASFTLSDLNLTSLGATKATKATVKLGEVELGTFDATSEVDESTFGAGAFAAPLDGKVDIDVEIPADAPAGAQILTVELDNGTVVSIPVTVGAGEDDGDDDTDAPGAGSLASLAPVFGSSVALLHVLGFEGANAEGSLEAQTIGS